MAKYKIEKVDSEELWDAFVESSPQGTIYHKSIFLNSIEVNRSIYFVKKGDVKVAGTCVLEKHEGEVLSIPYVPYLNGILFSDSSIMLNNKVVSEQFKVAELLINEVFSQYERFFNLNCWSFTDVRPFSWYNYHQPDQGMFNVNVRYTSVLDKTEIVDYLSKIRSSRRQELKKAHDINIQECSDVEVLDKLHDETFKRQGIQRSPEEQRVFRQIAENALNNKFGKLLTAQIDDEIVSAVLILFDGKTAYYQFGATTPEFRNSGASTKTLYEAILCSFNELGVEKFDFVGVNSPQRGDFKLSFNGALVPYFQLSLA